MIHPDFDVYSKELNELITYDESALNDFRLYGFEWIDNLHFLLTPSSVISNQSQRKNLEIAVHDRFIEAGWEGTGKLSLLWLPPFVFPLKFGVEPEGVLVWHVKQIEDGVSWLLSPLDLPFEEFTGA